MIKHLKDGIVKARIFAYIQSWLDERDKEANRIKGYYLQKKYNKGDLCELTEHEFWLLFHQACNDDLQGKF